MVDPVHHVDVGPVLVRLLAVSLKQLVGNGHATVITNQRKFVIFVSGTNVGATTFASHHHWHNVSAVMLFDCLLDSVFGCVS